MNAVLCFFPDFVFKFFVSGLSLLCRQSKSQLKVKAAKIRALPFYNDLEQQQQQRQLKKLTC